MRDAPRLPLSSQVLSPRDTWLLSGLTVGFLVIAGGVALLVVGRLQKHWRTRRVVGPMAQPPWAGTRKTDGPGAAVNGIRGIIFDVDGTLLDSNDAHARAWAQALSEAGYPTTVERVRPLIGKGSDKLLPEVAGIDADSREAAAINRRRGEIFQSYLQSLTACAGARDLLQRLRKDGLTLVIASSADRGELMPLLDRAGVSDLIDPPSKDADRSKPDPDTVKAALEHARLDPREALMIGDTPYDVEAARRVNVSIIALRCGGWSDGALRGALAIYDDPADLLSHYQTSPIKAVPDRLDQ